MPDNLLGSRFPVRCSDGKTRTGTVVYINPYRIFAVLQFDFWRESFLLHRAGREGQAADHHPEAFERRYTPAEDAEIMRASNLTRLAERLGRTECALENRKAILRAEKQHVPHRQYTPSEDAEILKSNNLSATGRKLGRSEASLWMRRRTLRGQMQNDRQFNRLV